MDYYTRAQWGSAFERGGYELLGPVAEVYVHHFNSSILPERLLTSAMARMRGAQWYHAEVQGWGDIGYSWAVDDAGRIYEARGWNRTGAHTWGFNSKGYGVVWLGDSNVATPSDPALRAIAEVILEGINLRKIDPHPTIVAHRDRVPDTACCGVPMYQQLPAIRQLVVAGPQPEPPAPALPTEEDDVAVLIRINEPGSPFNGIIYVTDGIVKVAVPSMDVATELITAGIVKKQPDGTGWVNVSLAAARVPMTVDEWGIAGMPTAVANAVLSAMKTEAERPPADRPTTTPVAV